MARRSALRTLAQAMIALLLCGALVAPVATAQDNPPPELGDIVLEDPMTAAGAATITQCQTGKNPGQFGEDGLTLTINGSCFSNANSGFRGVQFAGLNVPDGEIRFDLRIISGYERLFLSIITRSTPGAAASTVRRPSIGLNVGTDLARIGFHTSTAITRPGLKSAIPADTWVNIAVRLQGPTAWLLIDDQPFMSFTDPEGGGDGAGLSIASIKTGTLDDGQDVVYMLRNLRVSGLAGSEIARLPSVGVAQTASQTSPQPAATRTPPRPTPMGEPWVGDIRFGYDPNGGDGVPDGGALRIQPLGTVLASVAWRNIPPGSTFTIETYMDEYPPRRNDVVMNQPQGQSRFPVLRLGAVDGADWVSTGVTLTVYVNGKEMASGHVILK